MKQDKKFNDFIRNLAIDQLALLKEVIKIKNKRDKDGHLTYIEERFLKYFKEKYSY